jgi:hypothetical protein
MIKARKNVDSIELAAPGPPSARFPICSWGSRGVAQDSYCCSYTYEILAAEKLRQLKQTELEASDREKQRRKELEIQEEERHKIQLNIDLDRFFAAFPDEKQRNAFIQEAIDKAHLPFLKLSWTKSGWESPLLRSCIQKYFCEYESITSPIYAQGT